jgi:hypothetical protein
LVELPSTKTFHVYTDVLLPSVYGNEVSESLKTLILYDLGGIKKQAGFEKFLLLKDAPYKSMWKKVEQYLNEC